MVSLGRGTVAELQVVGLSQKPSRTEEITVAFAVCNNSNSKTGSTILFKAFIFLS